MNTDIVRAAGNIEEDMMMRKSWMLRALTKAALLLFTLSVPTGATPESRAGTLFLLLSPSVRVNGMGQAGVALPDEPGGYYNPGAVPLANPRHAFQSRFYATSMDWLPGLCDDIRFNYGSAQVASTYLIADDFLGEELSMRASIHGFRTKLDWGPETVTDERGQVIGSSVGGDLATSLGVGLAFRSVVDLGVGITAKRVSSDLLQAEGTGNTFDYGILIGAPLVTILEQASGQRLTVRDFVYPKLDLHYGLAWRNYGGEIDYGSWGADPFPSNRNRGWSVSLGFDWQSESLNLDLARATLTDETYRPDIDGVNVTDESEDDKSGAEIELLETLALRSGEYSDYDGEVHLNTSGITLKSDGLCQLTASLLKRGTSGKEQQTMVFLIEHLSVTWSRFEYESRGDGSFLDDTSHWFIGFSF